MKYRVGDVVVLKWTQDLNDSVYDRETRKWNPVPEDKRLFTICEIKVASVWIGLYGYMHCYYPNGTDRKNWVWMTEDKIERLWTPDQSHTPLIIEHGGYKWMLIKEDQ